jgi:hypothetical protein
VYLVDTNVWLERLLDQESAEEVADFLAQVPSSDLAITDFAFHSIAVVLSRLNQTEALLSFIRDAFVDGSVALIRLEPEDTQHLVEVMAQFHLDFDDAYQYIAAENYSLDIVSFDSDFDRTERKRKTPSQVLME